MGVKMDDTYDTKEKIEKEFLRHAESLEPLGKHSLFSEGLG